jgi:hypothetical protein
LNISLHVQSSASFGDRTTLLKTDLSAWSDILVSSCRVDQLAKIYAESGIITRLGALLFGSICRSILQISRDGARRRQLYLNDRPAAGPAGSIGRADSPAAQLRRAPGKHDHIYAANTIGRRSERLTNLYQIQTYTLRLISVQARL